MAAKNPSRMADAAWHTGSDFFSHFLSHWQGNGRECQPWGVRWWQIRRDTHRLGHSISENGKLAPEMDVAKTWVLTDCENSIYLDDFDSQDLGEFVAAAKGCRVTKRRLHGGLQEGVDIVEVDNGTLRFVVVATRGMSLWKAWKGEIQLGWNSPVQGPVHPHFVDLGEPSGLGWLDGFDELLVRCGLESNGAPEFDDNGQLRYPLHGRVGNRPANKLEIRVEDTGRIAIVGVVRETRFLFKKLRLTATISTMPGSSSIEIDDEVENLSASESEMQMLYHVNIGDSLLDSGSQLMAPVETVVPKNDHAAGGIEKWSRYEAPQPGFEEQVYFLRLLADKNGDTVTLLKNAHATAGAALKFNTSSLPCFTVWKNTTALADGCVAGLEPGTNFPNPRAYEGTQKRVVKLEPGGKQAFALSLTACEGESEVMDVETHIKRIQATVEPRVFNTPQPGWCEGA